jgi:opacity protein-like surface antigen
MAKFLKLSVAVGVVILAAGAQAQSIYGEVGYSGLNYKEPGLKVSPDMMRGIVGYQFTPNVSAEGMLGLGSGTKTDGGTGSSLKVDNMLGAFVKLQAPLTDSLNVYGRLGAVHTSLKVNGASDNGSSFAYGVGATYDLSKAVYVNADYTNYYDRHDQKIDGYTIGIGYRF